MSHFPCGYKASPNPLLFVGQNCMQISASPPGGSGGVMVMIEGAKPRSTNTERKSILISIGTGMQLTQKKYKGKRKG